MRWVLEIKGSEGLGCFILEENRTYVLCFGKENKKAVLKFSLTKGDNRIHKWEGQNKRTVALPYNMIRLPHGSHKLHFVDNIFDSGYYDLLYAGCDTMYIGGTFRTWKCFIVQFYDPAIPPIFIKPVSDKSVARLKPFVFKLPKLSGFSLLSEEVGRKPFEKEPPKQPCEVLITPS